MKNMLNIMQKFWADESGVGVMLSYVLQTRMLEGGAFLVWLIFLCSWGCDTCAYCVGMLTKKLWGNHKM